MQKQYKLSPEQYSEILQILRLKDVFLIESNFKMNDSDHLRGMVKLNIEDKYSIFDTDGCAVFYASFKLTGQCQNKEGSSSDEEELFTIKGKFRIEYSKIDNKAIPKDFLKIFQDVSLSIMMWPYYRELIQNFVARASMPPVTLPLLMRK